MAVRAVFLAALLLAAPAARAQLRLEDLFTSSTAPVQRSPSISLKELDAPAARRLLAAQEGKVAAGKFAEVLGETETLLAWYSKESPDYAETLYWRARAYDGLGQAEQALEVARIYLGRAAKGPRRAWFWIRLATEGERTGRPAAIAEAWRRVVEEKLALEPAEALRGADAMLRLGDAGAVRRLLEAGLPEKARAQWSAEFGTRREDLLLESLLLADDGRTPLPPPRSVADAAGAEFQLRRALLLEIRRDPAAARDAYAALRGRETLLSAPSRELLAERIAAR